MFEFRKMKIKLENGIINYNFINEDIENNDTILVFLHEGLGSIKQWKDFPLELCKKLGLKGLVYDRFGYGESDYLKTKRDKYYLHIEAEKYLPELLDKLNIKSNIVLFGHSDGGTIALIYASLYPNKVKAIITEAAHVFVEDITIEGIKKALDIFQFGKLKETLTKYHGQNTEVCFYNWSDIWLSEEFKTWNIEYLLKDIKCESLIIQGKEDEYATLKQVEVIKDLLKHKAEIFVIDECKHIPHLQQKELVLSKTYDFIKNKVTSC